jgi:hypothetical protein
MSPPVGRGARAAEEAPPALRLADAPQAARADLGRRLRRLEREAWDRERERRRRHADLLRRWPPQW